MRRIATVAAAALACLPVVAFAEGPDDSFWAELSYFYPTISSTARLDLTSTSRPGTTIRLEDDLALDDRKGTPYLTLGMRLGERWRLEFEYYQLNRSSSNSITRQIEWGDVTYPLGVTIDSTFDTTIFRITGGYSFYKAPVAEAGVGFGLHITDIATALSGQGTGPNGVATFHREARDTLVPLPTVGLYGTYKMSDQWHLRGRVDFLSLKYEDYDGSLINSMAAIEWRFAKNWGAGIGYRYVDYKLEATSSDFRGEINYKFKGPTLFVNAAF
jgi:Outer membrane protein beta-barrel domain